jgi:hypothetical protein
MCRNGICHDARLVGDKYPLLTVPPPPSGVPLREANIDFFLDPTGAAIWTKVKPILNHYVSFTPSYPGHPHLPPVQSLLQYTNLGGSAADLDVVTQLAAGHPVVIHGTQDAKLPPDPGHTMLATGVIRDAASNVTGIVANDPWLGQQVIIGWDPTNQPTTYHRALIPNSTGPTSPTDTYQTLSNFDFKADSYFYVTIN